MVQSSTSQLPPAPAPAPAPSSSKSSHPNGTLIILAIILGTVIGIFVLYRHRRGRMQRVAYPTNNIQDLNLSRESTSPRGPHSPSQNNLSIQSNSVYSRSNRSNSISSTSNSVASSAKPAVYKEGDEMKEVEIL